MQKRRLEGVTLLGIDGANIERLILAAEICKKYFEFADVKLLTSLPSDHKDVVHIEPVTSIEAYSEFVIKDLYKYVDTPYVLIIQYDGFILNPSAWSDEFLNYDYIGAPWFVDENALKYGLPREKMGEWVVGNGGFSLRTKKFLSVCADIASKGFLKKYNPADVVLCADYRELLEKNGIKFAPVDLAKKFSYEGISDHDFKWNGQFGFHGLKYTDITNWTKENSDYESDMKVGKIVKVGS